jgi:hypothetical protein
VGVSGFELIDGRIGTLTSIIGGADPEPVKPVLNQFGNFVRDPRSVVNRLESEKNALAYFRLEEGLTKAVEYLGNLATVS